jgi:hypothetical protein
LGAHSYDPGTAPSLLLWTVEIPEGNVHVDLDAGEATLHIENRCDVFDAFTVPNSLNPLHPLGLVTGFLRSMRVHWSGVKKVRSFNNHSTFRGDFLETSARIELTIRTPSTNPPFTPGAQDGFEFVADPETTDTHFAQIGHENNGALF